MEKYVYNKDGLRFERQKRSAGHIFRTVMKYFLASIALAALYYIIIAVFFSTSEEKRLRAENRLIEEKYGTIEEKVALLDDIVAGLEVRDRDIYSKIFDSEPIFSDWEKRFIFLNALDSLPESEIVHRANEAVEASVAMSSSIGGRLSEIARIVSDKAADSIFSIPLSSPVPDFTITQTGASIGRKMNPFYKIVYNHTGLDILAYAGDKVVASAPGTVKQVVRAKTGMGNYVVIDHGHGYESIYAHLSEINVRKGRRIARGEQVGVVGVSGLTFAAHLHYEVHKDGKTMNPVHYFFASESPSDYIGMIRLSAGTGQSLD